jgi:hypothetical protein
MKTKTIILLHVLALFATIPLFALVQDPAPEVDLSNASSVVAYLSTFIVLAATWLGKKFIPSITGTWTLVFVTALSVITTWITNALGDPSLSWIAQFGLGVGSVFIHQWTVQTNEK